MDATIPSLLESQGFVHLRQGISPSLIENLAQRSTFEMQKLSIFVRNTESGFLLNRPVPKCDWGTLGLFASRLKRSSEFRAIKNSKQLNTLISHVFGTSWKFYYRRGSSWARVSLPRRYGFQMGPHQDSAYLGSNKDIYVIWIPLHNCSRKLGGLGLVPGTHKLGFLRHKPDRTLSPPFQRQTLKKFEYQIGDVMIFHYDLIHGGTPNLTQRTVRTSIDFRIQPSGQS